MSEVQKESKKKTTTAAAKPRASPLLPPSATPPPPPYNRSLSHSLARRTPHRALTQQKNLKKPKWVSFVHTSLVSSERDERGEEEKKQNNGNFITPTSSIIRKKRTHASSRTTLSKGRVRSTNVSNYYYYNNTTYCPVSPQKCVYYTYIPPSSFAILAKKTPMHMLQSLQTVLDGNNCNNPFIQ